MLGTSSSLLSDSERISEFIVVVCKIEFRASSIISPAFLVAPNQTSELEGFTFMSLDDAFTVCSAELTSDFELSIEHGSTKLPSAEFCSEN